MRWGPILVILASVLTQATSKFGLQATTFEVDIGSPISLPSDGSFLSTTMDICTVVNHDHCNLTSPRLHKLADQLHFQYIRIGGTDADFTWYDLESDHHFGPRDPPSPFFKTVTRRDWDDVNTFVQSLGLKMFWGLNAGWGAGVRIPPATSATEYGWLPDMAWDLLNYSYHKNYSGNIAGFEYSNEPNLYWMGRMNKSWAKLLTGNQFSKDIVTARHLVDEFKNMTSTDLASASHWKLVCCDVAFVPVFGEFFDFIQDFASGGGYEHVDAATWHFYPLLGAGANKTFPPSIDPFYAFPDQVVKPLVLDQVSYFAEKFSKDMQHKENRVPLWLGETGSAVGGGQNGLSNRFADSIEYVDKIGSMTQLGQQHIFRQTLCGSDDQYYALISHDLNPHPSYFTTALLQRFVFVPGVRALPTRRSTPPSFAGLAEHVRLYTYQYTVSGRGDYLAFTAINLDWTSSHNVTMHVNTTATANSSLLWVLKSGETGKILNSLLTSDKIQINDLEMSVDAEGNIQPPLDSIAKPVLPVQDGGTGTMEVALEVPPLSISVILVPISP